MVCPACGAENREGAKFCVACGQGLAIVLACPTCGTPHDEGDRFCAECGRSLIGSAETLAPEIKDFLGHPGGASRSDSSEKVALTL